MARGKNPFGGNMNNMMKQMKQMQKQIEEAQKEVEETTISATAGGGVVEVTVNGNKEVLSIKIDPEAVDPEDVEMLEDMVMAGVNEALRKADEVSSDKMGKLTGGLNIPGL